MTFTDLGGGINLEVDNALEGLGLQVDMTIVIDIEPEVYALVDGKAGD
jgi:hypothetical protein